MKAVIEGAGDHCCEYMTGGIIVVLGSTGRNIGAGMTGGITFLLDENNQVDCRVNKEIVEVHKLSTHEQEAILKPLIEEHFLQTNSYKAEQIIKNWNISKRLFKVLVPPSEKLKLGLKTASNLLH